MKKILFLLLFTITSYGQAVFDEGIQVTNIQSTTASKVNVQETDGTINTILKSDLVDVLEYNSAINLPVTGVAGKLYVTIDNKKLYRWNGTIYQEIAADAVSSVNGKVGAVTLTTVDVGDAVNKRYQTDVQRTNNDATSSIQTQLNSKQNTLTNPVTSNGALTTNSIPKVIGTNQLGNSNISDTGTLITLPIQTRFNGSIGMGAPPTSSIMIDSNGFPLTGSSNAIGLRIRPTIGLDVTASFTGISSNPFSTNNLSVGNIFHFSVSTIGLGTGSSVSNQNGFYVPNTFITATNNYAFRSMLPSGANNWNLYLDGTAKNYINGNVLLKTTTDNGIDALQVNGTISASPATLSNQVVVKSQLDLKANIASPTFTGTVTAEPATLDTELATLGQVNTLNTNKLNTSDFLLNQKNTSFVKLIENNSAIKNCYFKKKTEGSIYFALGMVINGEAVQIDFQKDVDNFTRIAFIYTNTLSGNIMDETGRKLLSTSVLEFAINGRGLGDGLSNNWIPNHTPAGTGAIINLTTSIYIDGVLTNVTAMGASDFVCSEVAIIQNFQGANVGSATPLWEGTTTHKFKDGKLSVSTTLKALQVVEMFNGYSSKITGYLAQTPLLAFDDGSKIIPAATGNNIFYDKPLKSTVFYSDTYAIAVQVENIPESISFGKAYSPNTNKILFWDRAATPSVYWQWLPNISGGVAGTGTVLPIGTILSSNNTIIATPNINKQIK